MIADLPFISVVLPVRNESTSLPSCLKAILNQDYPANRMEILIVDGMSTDNTRSLIRGAVNLYPQIKIFLLDNPDLIVPIAMNIALQRAKGAIIVRVDGHTTIAPDYVRQCVETLGRTKADNAGGRMNAVGNNSFGMAVALATSTPFGVGGSRFHYSEKEEWVDTVYMGAWPRSTFKKIGLFDEELIRDQDDEFNYRLRAKGGCIVLSPTIRSEYGVRSTPRSLWKQYYQYGYWKVRVLQKHPHQMSLRQFVPPVFVLGLFASGLLALSPISRPAAVVLPVLYILANLIACLITSVKKGGKYLLILTVAFLILHVSYGLGFLVGMMKFWNRWSDKTGKTPAWSGEPIE